jgi:hypothetical protein
MSVKQAEELQSNITEEYFAKKMFEATLIFFGCIFRKAFRTELCTDILSEFFNIFFALNRQFFG